jgi:hypothetical protein
VTRRSLHRFSGPYHQVLSKFNVRRYSRVDTSPTQRLKHFVKNTTTIRHNWNYLYADCLLNSNKLLRPIIVTKYIHDRHWTKFIMRFVGNFFYHFCVGIWKKLDMTTGLTMEIDLCRINKNFSPVIYLYSLFVFNFTTTFVVDLISKILLFL